MASKPIIKEQNEQFTETSTKSEITSSGKNCSNKSDTENLKGFESDYLEKLKKESREALAAEKLKRSKKIVVPIEDYLKQSVNEFTIDLYKAVAGEQKGNLVMSSFSVHIILTMIASGAQDTTFKEIQQALHLKSLGDLSLDDNENKIFEDYEKLVSGFNILEDVVLKLANKIYVSNNFRIKERFREILRTYFLSESQTIDFNKTEEAVQEVNQWCSHQTNNKIKDLIKKDNLSRNTAMILLNAVYFKGDWKHKFEKDNTKLKQFHLNTESSVEVPMMQIEKNFLFNEIKGLNASYVLLPYENEDVYLAVIIPEEILGLENIENNLSLVYNAIFEKRNEWRNREVNLTLPKFKIETTVNLKSQLEKLGIKEMFTKEANFTEISEQDLIVDQAIQKAFIEVNEEGTEAAACNIFLMRYGSIPPPPKVFIADRPFLYIIFYKEIALFTGRVVNPLS